MPSHSLVHTEMATFDPGSGDGSGWLFSLPATSTNGHHCTLKSIADDQTLVTVQAQGATQVEDPNTPGGFFPSIQFSYRAASSITFTYSSELDSWVIYGGAPLISAMAYYGDWTITRFYQKNDLVRHQGGMWIAVRGNVGVEPSVGVLADWEPLIFPGSGSVAQSVDQVIGTLSAFVPLAFDTEKVAGYGCTFDLVNDQYNINFAGVWQETLSLFIAHDNSNQSRSVKVRIWSVTDSVELGSVNIGIGRNVENSSATVNLMKRFDAASVDDVLRWEIGPNVGSVASLTVEGFTFGLIQVSV